MPPITFAAGDKLEVRKSHQKRRSEEEIGTRRIKFKITCGATPSESKFRVGDKVEVRSDEKDYEGAWYAAEIVGSYKHNKFVIEYENLITDDETQLLEEIAKEDDIRPHPPGIPGNSIYEVGQEVDVWYNEGWWEGVISRVVDDFTYVVYFATTNEELMFQRSGSKLSVKKRVYKRKNTTEFGKGSDIEVRSNEKEFMGAWYRAVIVEAKDNNIFLVEYKTLLAHEESGLLREVVDGKNIRPNPPRIKAQFYEPLQRVDVCYNDGWWEGIVSQVNGGSTYGVYLRSIDEEMEFHRSELRLHQEWANGKWVVPSKDRALLKKL